LCRSLVRRHRTRTRLFQLLSELVHMSPWPNHALQRSRHIGCVTALLLAGVVGSLLWRTSGPREPVFEGRRLTSWLDHHVASSAASPPYHSPGWKKADEAIRHVGTNAIPTLLKMIRAKDRPPFVIKLMEMARRRGWTRTEYRYALPRHEEAEYAFSML